MKIYQPQQGFTLFEMVIAVSIFALMGVIAAMITNLEDSYQEKDFRLYGHLPGFDDAMSLWHNCRRDSPYSPIGEPEIVAEEPKAHDGTIRTEQLDEM